MSGGSRRGSLASLSLLLLAAALLGLAPAALASVPRGAATLSAPSCAADVVALATSPLEHTESADFRVFAGDELGTARLRTFEPSYPETRVGGFGLPGEARVGAERSLRLRAPWACDERSCGRATGSGEFRIFDAAGSSRSASAFGWNRLFQGREYLGFVDAYDFRARILWPEIGRFGQEDPLGTVDSANLYQAFGNNWVYWTDPEGRWMWDPAALFRWTQGRVFEAKDYYTNTNSVLLDAGGNTASDLASGFGQLFNIGTRTGEIYERVGGFQDLDSGGQIVASGTEDLVEAIMSGTGAAAGAMKTLQTARQVQQLNRIRDELRVAQAQLQAATSAYGRRQGAARVGDLLTDRAMVRRGWEIGADVRYGSGHGIDRIYERRNTLSRERVAAIEVKSRTRPRLGFDTQGIEQGSTRFNDTRLARATAAGNHNAARLAQRSRIESYKSVYDAQKETVESLWKLLTDPKNTKRVAAQAGTWLLW